MGQLYQANTVANLYGQEVQNRFYYWTDTNTDLSEVLSDLVAEFIVGLMMELASSAMEWVSVRVKEAVFDQWGHTTVLSGAVGNQVGQTLSAFNAVNCRFTVASARTRGGSKRLAGSIENYFENGALTSNAEIAYNGAAALLGSSLTDGVSVFQPVVVRPLVGGYFFNAITGGGGASWSTQNSRKSYNGGSTRTSDPLFGGRSTLSPVALTPASPAVTGAFITYDPKTPPTALGGGGEYVPSGTALVPGNIT